ncbi:lipopolysaccharide export system protein LptA [Pseudoduganella flava]|uniref:Lipopolysaccharide export system protein LptA n=1 Tax=Pseudoduganella flava TaxID=871742 RepID=A0A562PM88_9BURK|nr:lipopolysaccharide transport periplasmic protein LptA [Pseudoduganella flava]QGZ40883.1 lipopolysaccharide transport periplasmic protein LptA [Pseudoduganella flava]TWI45443.1 lipopolysaccharide export system protein LptA [Pseudoduganella flava]
MQKIILSAVLLLGVAGYAAAEKADSFKPTQIDYDKLDVDDVKQVYTATGNVVLTRGTLLMKADKAVVTYSPDGYQVATLTGGGKKVTFRQKRDGEGDQWMEGEADRIEYDERAELVKMFSRAKIRRLEGTKPSDEVEGEFISYDSRKEFFSVRNTNTGADKPGGGRGTMVIQPKRTEPAPAPATPAAEK